jgi:hypothetical protein
MSVDLSLVPPTVGPRFPRHDGSAAGSDDDFIILPDPSIGEPLSAGTNRTLRGYHAATQAQRSNRVALLFLGLIFGGLFGFIVVKTGLPEVFQLVELEVDADLLTLMAFASMAFAGIVCAVVGFLLPLAFRKPLVTYVGQNGLMRYVKSRFGGPKTELLCFPDADELKVSRVRNHQNGAYVGTTYDYQWYRQGRSAFRIAGMYRDDHHDPIDPSNFAFAAEKAWTRFRLQQVQEQMRREGVVRFRAGGDWIGVGDGFIEIGWKGAVERLDKAAIQSLSLAQGMLTIKRQGAKEGIFRSEGVFRFPVSAMSDFRTFLVALEVCTGYRFD